MPQPFCQVQHEFTVTPNRLMKNATHLVLLVFSFALPFFADAGAKRGRRVLERKSRNFKNSHLDHGFADGETGQQDDGGIGEQVDAILKADLRRTHVFEVIERTTETLPLSEAGCRERHL